MVSILRILFVLVIRNETDCTTVDIGDNHAGYFGFRNSTNHTFIDDGAMNVVVREWQQQTP
jgi:hypothetical protein